MKQVSATRAMELVAVGAASVFKAQTRLVACQNCSPSVSRSFASVLVEVLGARDPMTAYFLSVPAQCPNCSEPVVENTLVRCEGERHEYMQAAAGPRWEDVNVMFVDEAVLSEAQTFVTGCEQCVPCAEMTFDYILDEVTGSDPALTEYVLCHTARCPRCNDDITEKTFVIVN